jgi:nitrite reductase (cytochrome c-552)
LQIVESENSHGFHAPQGAVRILGEAIDYIRQGQLSFAARELYETLKPYFSAPARSCPTPAPPDLLT